MLQGKLYTILEYTWHRAGKRKEANQDHTLLDNQALMIFVHTFYLCVLSKLVSKLREAIFKKFRKRETLNLSTDADSSTDTTVSGQTDGHPDY